MASNQMGNYQPPTSPDPGLRGKFMTAMGGLEGLSGTQDDRAVKGPQVTDFLFTLLKMEVREASVARHAQLQQEVALLEARTLALHDLAVSRVEGDGAAKQRRIPMAAQIAFSQLEPHRDEKGALRRSVQQRLVAETQRRAGHYRIIQIGTAVVEALEAHQDVPSYPLDAVAAWGQVILAVIPEEMATIPAPPSGEPGAI